MAQVLDSSEDVAWWLRNDPVQFSIWSRIGRHAPDFLVALATDPARFLFVEVKGSHLWGRNSDAHLKASDLRQRCAAGNLTLNRDAFQSSLILAHVLPRATGPMDLLRLNALDGVL